MLFTITWKTVRNRLSWLWSCFFGSSTSLLARSSWAVVYNSSILLTRTINNISLWILTSCVIYIMDVLFQSVCNFSLMLLSIGVIGAAMCLMIHIGLVNSTWAYSGLLMTTTVAHSILTWYILVRSTATWVLVIIRFLCLNLRIIRMIAHLLRLTWNMVAWAPAVAITIWSSRSISTFIFFILIMNTLRIYITRRLFYFTSCQLFQISYARL